MAVIAASVWISGYPPLVAAEPVAPSGKPETVAQPAQNDNSITLFGQSFPANPGSTTLPETLKSLAPKELLELGSGTPTRLYIERIKFPGQISGSDKEIYFVAGQNLIETRDGDNYWPYFASRVEVYAGKNDQGISVINHMHLKGSFDPELSRSTRYGSRKDAKAMISALCKVMGRPRVQVRKHPISELRFVSSDALVWNTRDATIWLYFEKHLTANNLGFLFDIAGSKKRTEMQKDRARDWDPDPKPLPADYAKQFDGFCDRAKFDL